MEELQKLYDVLVRDGYYTNDFETFISKWDDPEYKQKVYEVTSREGLYTQDFESFNNKYTKKKPKPFQRRLYICYSKAKWGVGFGEHFFGYTHVPYQST